MPPVLEARNITKRFPGVLANERVSFSLNRGEVLAFLGENGAGKSTLMNILYGLYRQDEGDVLVNGEPVIFNDPSDAIARGIGMVHQHFMLVPVMTVVENVVLGNETQHAFRFDLTGAIRGFQRLLRRINPVSSLQRQFARPYAMARSALVAALLYLLFFGFESLLFSLGRLFWAVLFCVAAIAAGGLHAFGRRREGLPWDVAQQGRWWSAGLSLGIGLLVTGGAAMTGLLPGLSALMMGFLRVLLYAALFYVGMWVLFGAYLILLELLGWLSELAPLRLTTDARKVAAISHQYGLDVDPYARVNDLPVGAQQRVEIVKALYREADILILDEPTAVLTPQEADDLFDVMRSLTAQGKSIIFITHKLKEVLAVADRIVVLRQGRVAGEAAPQEATEASLAAMMVGREVILTVDKDPLAAGEPVLKVENLQALDERHQPVLQGVNLEVRAGEILGIAGVQGNGQTELVRVLTGLQAPEGGAVWINGIEATGFTPRQVTELGVAHVPEDRVRDGLVLSYPVYDNLILNSYYRPPFAHGPILDHEAVYRQADDLVRTFDVRTPTIAVPVKNLSGGNMQKVIVARELARPVKLLIAAQPTRGLDVGSIEFIHRRIVEKRSEGVAVLLVSAELDEIMSLSDRIAVMYEGEIVFTIDSDSASREELGLWMAGGPAEKANGGHTGGWK